MSNSNEVLHLPLPPHLRSCLVRHRWRPVRPICQDGPQCGLVALSMALEALGLRGDIVFVARVYGQARLFGFTTYGEMFSAINLKRLAERMIERAEGSTVVRLASMKTEVLVAALDRDELVLVAYDAADEEGQAPCFRKGLGAHWAVIHGYLQVELEEGERFYFLGSQGRCGDVGVWRADDLVRSNRQLVQLNPNYERCNMVIPEEGIHFGLADQCLLLGEPKSIQENQQAA